MSPVMIHEVPNFQQEVQRERLRVANDCAGIVAACMKEFDPFRLDPINRCLWQRNGHGDEERILLKPKAFGILRYLVDHAGRLVTQEELLDALWPDTFVQPEVLKRHIVDIRNVLGDNPKSPTYIETRPRLGYQFITAVRNAPPTESGTAHVPDQGKVSGKDQALCDLQTYLGSALGGERQIVLVAGKPGVGKTTLVGEFQTRAAANPTVRIGKGQCLDGGEVYHPILEVLYGLCREPAGVSVAQILAAQAPTWLAQFPSLIHRRESEKPQLEIPGAVRRKMLLEIADALETIASARPLLLVLEDLHWADSCTIDSVSTLAHGRCAAKLMVIGTYRPADFRLSGNPLTAIEADVLVHRYVMNSFWSRCGDRK